MADGPTAPYYIEQLQFNPLGHAWQHSSIKSFRSIGDPQEFCQAAAFPSAAASNTAAAPHSVRSLQPPKAALKTQHNQSVESNFGFDYQNQLLLSLQQTRSAAATALLFSLQ